MLLNTKRSIFKKSFFIMYSSRLVSKKYPKRYKKYRYNLKDIYSPSLYKADTPNYYQQKGRVLQQSPRLIKNSPNVMISKKVLDKYYQTLLSYKYPIPQPPPELKQLSHSFTYSNMDLGLLEYEEGSTLEFKFSDIWDSVINDYQDILAIENIRVKSLYFYVSLLSFAFGGDTTVTDYDPSAGTYIIFGVNTTDQTSQTYDREFQNGFLETSPGVTPDIGFGMMSYNNPSYIWYSSSVKGIQIANKLSMTNQPYLNVFPRGQVAMLTVLRNKDYSLFNPTLIKWTVAQFAGGSSITLNKHLLTVQISLTINYE